MASKRGIGVIGLGMASVPHGESLAALAERFEAMEVAFQAQAKKIVRLGLLR